MTLRCSRSQASFTASASRWREVSGANVIVGLRPGGGGGGGQSWARAVADGLEVRPVADAARAGDVIMMLVPDQEQRAVYEDAVAPALGPGKTLMFAHGFNIHFGEIVPPTAVDVSTITASESDPDTPTLFVTVTRTLSRPSAE